MGSIRAFSYGGGVQSTAALVLAAEGRIDFPLFLFANVGADSENPDTIEYVATHAIPYARAHDIEIKEVRKQRRDGTPETLMERINRTESTIPIPMRLGATAAPGNRSCTQEFKIRVIDKEIKRQGATARNPAVVGLGISLDEFHRMKTDSGAAYKLLEYPLIDLRLRREDCLSVIESAGLPVPPRSACYFCPYHRLTYWQELRRDHPDRYDKVIRLERKLHDRGERVGRTEVFLTRHGRFLDDVLGSHDQLDLFEGGCDIAGYCNA
jgi:hypothetical protein